MKLLKSLAVAASSMLLAASATAKDYRMLSSWDQNYAYNPYIVDPFVQGLDKATNGRIKITVSGPETVPPFEQLEPVGSGVFQFLFTHGAYHVGSTPIMMVAEAIDADPEKLHASGLFDYLDKQYQRFGVKLVAAPVTPKGAYHYLLRAPIGPDGGMKGRKIRGTVTYKGVTDMLGGVLVVLAPSEIYTSLEKGLVDGAVWPAVGAYEYRWYEVAKYLVRPAIGVNYEPIFMNLDAWNALPAGDQKIVMSVARQIEDAWYKQSPAVWKKEEDALLAKGMQITKLGPAQQAKLDQTWKEGLWAAGAEKNAADTNKLRDFARSKGLAQ
ncbi:TRAP transporter substrate-binding protein DctP [Pigmentiphaga soli]|uniref:TRAP transporter substrate-binding protein DctP n=1 Tax=Pigmentiphaga soli TaxID=1007095 RepID=A0ABP8HNV5_9BURK